MDEKTTAEETANEQSRPAGGSAEKTFTATELDAEVKRRIDKQNAKHSREIEERNAQHQNELDELSQKLAQALEKVVAVEEEKSALELAKQRDEWAEIAAKETGVPASVIRGGSAEEMLEHAKAIAEAMSAPKFPRFKDSGGKSANRPTEKSEFVKNLFSSN